MAQATGQRGQPHAKKSLERILLLLYLVVTVALIGLTWVENLNQSDRAAPGYISDTFVIDKSVYLTVTAEAAAAELERATPRPPTATPHATHTVTPVSTR